MVNDRVAVDEAVAGHVDAAGVRRAVDDRSADVRRRRGQGPRHQPREALCPVAVTCEIESGVVPFSAARAKLVAVGDKTV